ncbi:MAG: hypothetical protein RR329_08095 [Mucinivorans sp.]
MMKIVNILIIALGVMLSSCTKVPMGGDEPLPEGAVQISLSLPNAGPLSKADVHTDEEAKTAYESRILSATVLFYDHATQKLTQKVSTGQAGISWDDVDKKVIISSSSKLILTATYDIVVLTNLPDAASLEGTIAVGDSRAQLNDVFSKLTSPIVLDDTHALLMMGETQNHTFSKNITATVALAHQAVKIGVNVSITPEFAAIAGAFFTAATEPSRLALYNVPNMSWITGNHAADNLFTRFNNLTSTMGYTLMDYAPVEMTRTAATNLWSATLYAYENVVDGLTADHKKRATSFVLQVPYLAAGVAVNENYYKVMIEDPTASESASKYKTVRNHLYDVNVGINGFGNPIALLEGVEIKTTVVPWGNVATDVDTDAKELFTLSNTECQIVGDHADNIVIAQATLSQVGAAGQIKVEAIKGGENFTVNSPINIVGGVPTDITINVSSNFTEGKVRLTVGHKSQEILLSKQFDKAKMDISTYNQALSSATWCTLSPNATYNQAEQTQKLEGAGSKWLHVDKTSLSGDATRMASVMLTRADNSVVRMTVVQQPYVATGSVKWATGNIELGHRPDGTSCYVIGAATDYGLLFQFMTAAGIARGDEGTPWSGAINIYNPSGTGSTAAIGSVTHEADWEKKVLPTRTQDPCSYIASPDGTQWRTPTAAELQLLIDNKGGNHSTATQAWSGTSTEQQGFHTLAGRLFFSCPGRREHGSGAMHLSDQSKGDMQVSNRSSTTGSTLAVMPGTSTRPNGDCIVFNNHQDTYAMPVRCVRR